MKAREIIMQGKLQLLPLVRSHLAGSVRVCPVRCWVFLLCPNLATCLILELVSCGAEDLQCIWAVTQGLDECLCGDYVLLETYLIPICCR